MEKIRVIAVIFFLISIAGLTDLARSNKMLFSNKETYGFRIYGGCATSAFKSYSLTNAHRTYELTFHENRQGKSYVGFDEVQKGFYKLSMVDYFGNKYELDVGVYQDKETEYSSLFRNEPFYRIMDNYEAEKPLQIIYTYGLYECGKEVFRLSSRLGSKEYIVEHLIEIKENSPLDYIKVKEHRVKEAFLNELKLLEENVDINTFEVSVDDILTEKVTFILGGQKKIYQAENGTFSFIRDFETLLEKYTIDTKEAIVYLPVDVDK